MGLNKGDYVFTCKTYPLIFSHYIDEDTFETTEGTQHSLEHCKLIPISRKYALWFLSNKIYEAFNELSDYSKLSPFKRIDKNHYIRVQGNLEFHYVGESPIKKDKHSRSYMKRFYQRWLIYKGFRLELKQKYDVWDVYKQYIQQLCKQKGIEYEGY